MTKGIETTQTRRLLVGVVLVLILGTARSDTQVRYLSGQTVAPVFEGWEPNADGTFDMYFGYMNRNYEEHLEIPIGPNNSIEPGGPDRGQPTHFYPRRKMLLFKVTVPKDWGDKDVVWTLTTRGHTETAYGSLWPVWQIGEQAMVSMRGGDLGKEENQAPSVKLIGAAQATVRPGGSLTLAAEISDDGIPGLPAGRRAVGPTPRGQMIVRRDPGVVLGMTWVVYRGEPGSVSFAPQSVPVKDGKAETKASFSKPGTYVLRGYADDGVRTAPVDVTVTVTGDTLP